MVFFVFIEFGFYCGILLGPSIWMLTLGKQNKPTNKQTITQTRNKGKRWFHLIPCRDPFEKATCMLNKKKKLLNENVLWNVFLWANPTKGEEKSTNSTWKLCLNYFKHFKYHFKIHHGKPEVSFVKGVSTGVNTTIDLGGHDVFPVLAVLAR